MPPKKRILRELARAQEGAQAPAYLRPATITGYTQSPDRYQRAVNELLRSRLVEGRKDEEGRMTIALNPHRLPDVHRILRPVWARPTVWALLALGIAVGAGLAVA